uniref:Uncharacterized protein n=1 Tax=Timema shepardi TaxID=629360 RepID=A0A7R9ARE7_TIMSH|nr:unnamed protein product [Timema shepardi]
MTSVYRHKTALKTDERVRLMDEIISGVRVIKMYAWEKPFSDLIKVARKAEIKNIKMTSYLRGIYMSFTLFTNRIALYSVLVAIVLMGGTLTADKVFVYASFFSVLGITMAGFFNRGVAELAETLVSIDRLQTSLLQAILGELPKASGSCVVNGKISYACQEPWVFGSTIRQNIVFGSTFNKTRYDEVLRVCALLPDMEQFPQRDLTLVGERGSSLSGGQKARVNLARAVYNDADVYLLDDPLSAVDTHVGKHLFDECINSYLKHKTRILVTHQLQYLTDVDSIGRSKQNQPVEEEEAITDDTIYLESHSKGESQSSTYMEYFKSGTNYFFIFLMAALFLLAQGAASLADYWASFWTIQEEMRNYYRSMDVNIVTLSKENLTAYQTDMGNSRSLIALLDLHSTEFCLYMYTGIILILTVLAGLRSYMFYKICVRCSERLHNNMFNSVIRTTMRFFDLNPSGRILNRFSKDIGCADELLTKSMMDAAQYMLTIAGSIVLAVVVNYLLIVLIIILGILLWFIRKVYLKTSINIKRLEGITKSPVFTHLNATLQGISTIRAYGAQSILKDEFDKHQDLHTSAYYMFITTSSAFGFSLDSLCFIYISLVTFSFLFLKEAMGGSVGLAITQSLLLIFFLQWGLRQTTEVANNMMSVERILEYKDLEEEPLLESTPDKTPSPEWPKEGRIMFQNTSLKYVETNPPVLKDLNISIQPKEKVGIVGRTGAGKSSLISALFRLARVEGTIRIDGVDTKDIGLQDLRSRISIIPQDPVLFSGTLRNNIDPFHEFSDCMLWSALEDVELKKYCVSSNGLDMKVTKGGSNFSVGQRQLICLARAILRNNKILMLDEATANVDPQTDALIQNTIRLKFAECTVLTVAHRLNTIMDSDKVLVMDAGRMVEFASPHNLLQNKNGHFYQMVQKTGKKMAEQLYQVSEVKEASNKQPVPGKQTPLSVASRSELFSPFMQAFCVARHTTSRAVAFCSIGRYKGDIKTKQIEKTYCIRLSTGPAWNNGSKPSDEHSLTRENKTLRARDVWQAKRRLGLAGHAQ